QTVFAKTRHEPVTYWTMMGEHQSLGGWQKRLAELRHGLRGEIVDGLVFRVSSINPDQEAGFAVQDEFVQQIASSLVPSARFQLMGLR
ncbi:exosortase C-terminal domain/associated protein EpsI, partial [Ideonella sp.]|uniref:exosortase C-terminal domain/associated protein EpsI n=1 Tax=Ideonella sp. TaxID=1929293 RepID=UPI003BB5C149